MINRSYDIPYGIAFRAVFDSWRSDEQRLEIGSNLAVERPFSYFIHPIGGYTRLRNMIYLLQKIGFWRRAQEAQNF